MGIEPQFSETTIIAVQNTADEIITFLVNYFSIREVLSYLKNEIPLPYKMLYDITAIDERYRTKRQNQPISDFTVVYHLTSFDRNEDLEDQNSPDR